jgi:hypothetical protein
LWLALGLFAAFIIVGKWLSNKIVKKPPPANENVLQTDRSELLSQRHA